MLYVFDDGTIQLTRGDTARLSTVISNGATDERAMEAVPIYPACKASKSYTVGERIRYNGILYKVLQAHTSQEDWTPDVSVSLFAKVLGSEMSTIPAWEQPESTNPYKKGDKVTHNGFTWISAIDNNVWEPGVYGWEKAV